jgi:deoxyribodipyrimidine photo-lyase
MVTILWLDVDLRVRDHQALAAAVEGPGPVVPVYVWAPDALDDWDAGAARRWWLHHSLARLSEDLAELGSPPVLRTGDPVRQLRDVAEAVDADRVRWTRRLAPHRAARDETVREALLEAGLDVAVHHGRILHDPEAVSTNAGDPYRVFTPFWNRFQDEVQVHRPIPAPESLTAPSRTPESRELADLDLTPDRDWDEGLAAAWRPGEAGAQDRLEHFADVILADYPDQRDTPAVDGTSRLSPHLALGEVSPRDVWWTVRDRVLEAEVAADPADAYLRQLAWREFGYHLLHHHPETATEPLRDKYRDFPWRTDEDQLEAWKRGRTGYPLIDAGMRQLWETGWIHNRVRMVAAAFLTKHLLVPWQEGARWFWDTLVDADLANNTLGWQWAAGCGADAQPYFRMFNPTSQAETHDPDGAYIRTWVPELADLPDAHVHAPWEAPDWVLDQAGLTLGEDYPHPIVDHAAARERALDAYDEIRDEG